MPKITNLHPHKLGWRTMLHQMLEQDNIEAVVCVVRIDGGWRTTWCNETHGGLCMAAVKLMHDVTDWIHDDPGIPDVDDSA